MKAVKPTLNLARLSELNAAGNAAEKQSLRVHHSQCYSVEQVRTSFDDIEALAESMAERQIQPCVCWPKDEKGYRIHVGERRFRAAKHGDLYLDIIVDPILPQLTRAEAIYYQLVENTQRNNLTPREEANAVVALMNEGMTATMIAKARAQHEQISESTAQSWVSRMKKLASMPELIAIQHDAGLHDIETLNNLIDIYNQDRRVCENLIMDGSLSREATRKALKALKAGDTIPTLTQPATAAVAGNAPATVKPHDIIGPTDLLSVQYIVGVETQSFGFGGVIAVKFAERELKLSWLTAKDLRSEHLFDVKTRIGFHMRDFLKKIERSVKPHEEGDYAKLCEFWTDELTTEAPAKEEKKAPAQSGQKAEQKPDPIPEPSTESAPLTEVPPSVGSAVVEMLDEANAQQKPVQNKPVSAPEPASVVIHGFVDGDAVVLVTDRVLNGQRVFVRTSQGLDLEIPAEDFTLSHLTRNA